MRHRRHAGETPASTGEPLVRVLEGALSRAECRAVVHRMADATGHPGSVLRRSADVVDLRLRRCREHTLDAGEARLVVAAMVGAAREAHAGAVEEIRLDGPKFCSYGQGEYFRAHRDRSGDARDPAAVRTRRLTMVCALNDADPDGGLPVFDGGALILHVPGSDGVMEARPVQPAAGSLVIFEAGLLHEVRPVRAGTRYSAIAWTFAPAGTEPAGHDG